MTIRRAKGTGSVQKKGDSYYFRIKINGKETSKKMVGVENDKQADLEATRMYTIAKAKTQEEIALFAGRARDIIKEQESIPVRAVFERFRNSSTRPSCSERTLDQHKAYWDKFTDWLQINHSQVGKLNEITKKIAVGYFDHIFVNKKARTFNAILNTLRLVYKTLGDGVNPFADIMKQDEDTQTRKELSLKQLEKLLKSIKDKKLHIMEREEMRVLLFLGAFTGLRIKDCALMKWNKIDEKNKTIRCKPFKTKKNKTYVTVPIHARLLAQFKKADKWKTNEYVLPKVAERYKNNPDGVYRDAKKAMAFSMWDKPEAGKMPPKCPGYTFHSLRHTFVSICANAGVPLSVVQEIVGHGNPAMTKYYTHVGNDALKQAIDTLPGSHGNVTTPNKKLIKIKNLIMAKKKLSKMDREILNIIK